MVRLRSIGAWVTMARVVAAGIALPGVALAQFDASPFPPAWIEETAAAFHRVRPDPCTGACPSVTFAAYRVWHPARGHHVTRAQAVRDRLVARAYIAEGWGAVGVAICGL